MKEQKKEKNSALKKILHSVTTVVLILSTLLCFTVAVRSAFSDDADLFGYRLFYVVSGSMEPTYPVGSILIVGESDEYSVSDVITFYSEDESIKGHPNTHRITEITERDGQTAYITKGDANDICDDIPVLRQDVIGKVHFCIHTSFFKNLIELLGTPTGFFVLILLPIVLVAVVCMKSFTKALNEELRRAATASLKAETSEQSNGKESHGNDTEQIDKSE